MDLDSLSLTGSDIYIYGVGLAGKWLAANLGASVTAFIDTDEKKVGGQFDGIPVLSLDAARARMTSQSEIVLTVIDVRDILALVETLPHRKWVALGLHLDDTKVGINPIPESDAFVEYALKAVENCHKAYFLEDRLFFRSIDLIITEKCSLKCRDCANLMQYYEAPINVAFDDLVRDFDLLVSNIDHIHEIRLIGGEPFMNKDIYRILRHIVQSPHVSRIVIYSNAMIPIKAPESDILTHDKIVFSLTNYGDLARHTPRVVQSLEAIGATYRLHPPENWTDSGVIFDYQRSEPELRQLFSECCGKNLLTVSDGKIYRCPFAANADRLKAVPRSPANSVAVDASRDEIRHYTSDIEYLPACNYCKGRSFGAPEIVPAIQAAKSLPYIKYA